MIPFNCRKDESKSASPLSVFDDARYSYSESDYAHHKILCSVLDDTQKASLLLVVGCFTKGILLEGSCQRDYAESMLAHRSDMLGMSYSEANSIINSPALVQSSLSTLDKSITDILLVDMKYLFSLLVSLTVRYRDGAKANQQALGYLYGIFVPLGYNQIDVYNPKDYMML